MNLETIFKLNILAQTFMFVLIISWGGYVQYSNLDNITGGAVTDIGGFLFLIFSISYFFCLYSLYKLKYIGLKLFLPLVGIFIVLGFATEFINPFQFSKDLFYLLIFYIISPVFFVSQGVLISLLYFTEIKNKFDPTRAD